MTEPSAWRATLPVSSVSVSSPHWIDFFTSLNIYRFLAGGPPGRIPGPPLHWWPHCHRPLHHLMRRGLRRHVSDTCAHTADGRELKAGMSRCEIGSQKPAHLTKPKSARASAERHRSTAWPAGSAWHHRLHDREQKRRYCQSGAWNRTLTGSACPAATRKPLPPELRPT